jgi:hypothetical protein
MFEREFINLPVLGCSDYDRLSDFGLRVSALARLPS